MALAAALRRLTVLEQLNLTGNLLGDEGPRSWRRCRRCLAAAAGRCTAADGRCTAADGWSADEAQGALHNVSKL